MAEADQTFVTTVADNMRQCSKREVEQAKAARELMAPPGYSSSQTTIEMLDAGIANCSVTKQDVRNADAIFGSSIPALKGKTHTEISASISSDHASCYTSAADTGRGSPLCQEDLNPSWPARAHYVHTGKV
jgi:hypothetical protein